jgi:hypothetical protein
MSSKKMPTSDKRKKTPDGGMKGEAAAKKIRYDNSEDKEEGDDGDELSTPRHSRDKDKLSRDELL